MPIVTIIQNFYQRSKDLYFAPNSLYFITDKIRKIKNKQNANTEQQKVKLKFFKIYKSQICYKPSLGNKNLSRKSPSDLKNRTPL